jgi:putative ABC transport system permease protein
VTGRRAAPRRLPRLGLDPASVLGRARADAWPLALTLLVVALAVALAAVTPRLADRVERDAAAAAVEVAGDAATLVVSHGLDQPLGDDGRRGVVPQVERLAALLDEAVAAEVPGLAPAGLRVMVSRSLTMTNPPDPLGKTTVRLVHLAHPDGPRVEWVAGRAPVAPPDLAGGPVQRTGDAPSVVEVGVSEATAEFLGVGPGDPLPGPGLTESRSEIRVAGVFRAVDPDDRAWAAIPEVLAPAPRGDEVVLSTSLAVLLTDDAFPAAFAALPPGSFSASYTYRADAEAVRGLGGDAVAQAVARAAANPAVLPTAPFAEIRSDLPDTLRDAAVRTDAARAQAGVLVAAVGAGAVLVVVLAAALLAARRRGVLTQHRARGASLPAVAVELAAESVPLAAVAAALGLLAADAVAPGPVPLWSTAPVVLAAAACSPVLGVRVAARAAGGRRPVTEARRRRVAREGALRRVAVEVLVVLAAAGAVASAQARDVAAGGVVVAVAPVLVALAGAVVVLRLVPWALRAGQAVATRTRHAGPLLAAGRARAATHPAALVALAAVAALGAFAGVLGATVDAGREQASWDAVGADVTARVVPAAAAERDVAAAAGRVAAAPGVDLALAARVEDLRFRSTWGAVTAHVVAVPTGDLARLARDTLAGGPSADRLAAALADATARYRGPGAGAEGAAPDDALPALVSDDLLAHSAEGLGVQWAGSWVPVAVAGRAPALDGRDEGLVVVDLAALDDAVAGDVAPNAVWAVGPGAADAVAAQEELADAATAVRSAWLEERRGDPLPSAVTAATWAAVALLAGLAALAVVLGAAADARERARTLATLRALGIGDRQARRVALGEMVPPVLLASAGGVAVGVGAARLLSGALDLRLVTAQALDPATVVPWWVAAPVLLAALTAAVVVLVEASVRRRERLGQVLRMGAGA